MPEGDNRSISIKPRSGEWRTPTNFDEKKYNAKGLSYPNDLFSNQAVYGGNYVIFYINVHEDPELVKKGTADSVYVDDTTPRVAGDIAGSNYSAGSIGAAATVEAGVVGATAGSAVVEKIANVAVGKDALKAGAARVIGAGAAIGAVGVAAAAIGGLKTKYRRMKTCVALHVPNDLSVNYGVNWEAEETGNAQVMAAIADAVPEAIRNSKGAMDTLVRTVSAPGAMVGAAASWGAGKLLQAGSMGKLVSKTSGAAMNPKKEQLFKEVNFREFSFNYTFFPRSADEAKAVHDIIHTFKYHMHPEYIDANHFLYRYPSEFDIFYYQDGKENMNLHRHTSCVLTSLNISYTPQSQFTTFDNGMPTQINVQMQFKELATLSKETIKDGF